MVTHSQGLEIYAANPSIEVVETPRGYSITAAQSRSLAAKVGSLILLIFCLVFLGAGVAVWFMPDDSFDGDPQLLKIIVTGATWIIFGPLVYYNFINTTTVITEIDLSGRMLHQVFLNRHGRETKRRSVAFADIKDVQLQTNDRVVPEETDIVPSEYGQIFIRLSASKGFSLIWGGLDDLLAVWRRMRQDILGPRK